MADRIVMNGFLEYEAKDNGWQDSIRLCDGEGGKMSGMVLVIKELQQFHGKEVNLIVELAERAPEPEGTRPSVNGALWVCYHALKASEWMNVNDLGHPCPYCGNGFSLGHDADCMTGNGLRMMDDAIRVTPNATTSTQSLSREDFKQACANIGGESPSSASEQGCPLCGSIVSGHACRGIAALAKQYDADRMKNLIELFKLDDICSFNGETSRPYQVTAVTPEGVTLKPLFPPYQQKAPA